MTLYEIAMPLLQIVANGETVMMALFTAYIDDYLGFEIFCSDFPMELFNLLRKNLQHSEDLRKALMDSGILEQGVNTYIGRTYEDYHMWYHFLDGTYAILKDTQLVKLLSADDRYVVEGLFNLWQKGEINEACWDNAFAKLSAESYSK